MPAEPWRCSLSADGLWGRVRHESAPVTRGLENARVGEMVSHLCWVAGAEGPGRKGSGELRRSRLEPFRD